MLRDVGACAMGIERGDECNFEERAWPLSCVRPWDLPPNKTLWAKTPPPVLRSLKLGETLQFWSRTVGIESSREATKRFVQAEMASMDDVRFLVDGKLLFR